MYTRYRVIFSPPKSRGSTHCISSLPPVLQSSHKNMVLGGSGIVMTVVLNCFGLTVSEYSAKVSGLHFPTVLIA